MPPRIMPVRSAHSAAGAALQVGVSTGGEPTDVTATARITTTHPSSQIVPLEHPGPDTLDVTVVLPCYNEQDHVLAELERITAALEASPFTYEILAIDDKSTDDTLRLLNEAETRFPHLRVMP